MTKIADIVPVKYAGAEWLKQNLKYYKPDLIVSELGEIAADILGQIYAGLYHLENKVIEKTEWNNSKSIAITTYDTDLCTFDSSTLTHLVLLAQATKTRVEIRAATHHYIKFIFTHAENHKTIEENIKRYLKDPQT